MLTLERIEIRQPSFRLDADFSVSTGLITALIGPSGAGKSSLLSIIGGFYTPASGRVLWNNSDISTLAPGARPCATLFQDNNLFPHLTVAANVGMALTSDMRLTPAQSEQVTAALSQVGLADMGTRKPATLSGGQQARAALARALLQDRPLVLLDEPFSALGPALKAEMLDLVRDTLAAAGRTVLMVTHDPADALRIADEILFVADGTVTGPHPTRELLDDPPPALRAYLGAK